LRKEIVHVTTQLAGAARLASHKGSEQGPLLNYISEEQHYSTLFWMFTFPLLLYLFLYPFSFPAAFIRLDSKMQCPNNLER
jgi:hypothetical protein